MLGGWGVTHQILVYLPSRFLCELIENFIMLALKIGSECCVMFTIYDRGCFFGHTDYIICITTHGLTTRVMIFLLHALIVIIYANFMINKTMQQFV